MIHGTDPDIFAQVPRKQPEEGRKLGKVDESAVTIEKYDAMLVFGKDGRLPLNAINDVAGIKIVLKSLQ